MAKHLCSIFMFRQSFTQETDDKQLGQIGVRHHHPDELLESCLPVPCKKNSGEHSRTLSTI